MRTMSSLIGLCLMVSLGASPVQADPKDESSAQLRRLEQLNEQVRAHPDEPQLHLARGELLRARGQSEAALAAFEQALALDNDLHDAQLAQARLLLDMNRPDAALQPLSKIIDRYPAHAQALLLRARAYARLGRHNQAETDFGAALVAMANPSSELFLERAGNLGKAKQYAAALMVLEEGIRQLGPVPQLDQAALEVELELGRHQAALARIESMLRRSSRPEALLARKGAVLEKMGRVADARMAREQALMAIEDLPQDARARPPTRRLKRELSAAVQQTQSR